MVDIPQTGLVLDEAVAIANGYVEQADIDSVDWLIAQLGVAGYGVISGCQVTQSGSGDMTITVAPGLIVAGSQQIHVAGGVSGSFSSSGTAGWTRYALVEIHATGGNFDGTIIKNAGTAALAPVFPAPTVGNIVLAALTIPIGSTSITTQQIVDKRVFINAGFSTAAKLFLSSVDWTRSRP